MTQVAPIPSTGEFVYVTLPFEGVREARIIAAGERYEVRLLASGQSRTVSPSSVWTAEPSDNIKL